MTVAPPTLLAARRFLLDRLDMHPGHPDADLDPAEVGIAGDTPHAAQGTSYHLGKGQLRGDAYSVIESARDRRGLSRWAAALDVGYFEVRAGGRTWTLYDFNRWLVAQCEANTPDTLDIREVIYSLDGRAIKRWDRLKRRSSGDPSHRTHTHLSYFRDSLARDKTGLFRRWMTEIGLIEGDDDDVDPNAVWWKADIDPDKSGKYTPGGALWTVHRRTEAVLAELAAARLRDEAILAAVKGADARTILARVDTLAAETARRDAQLRQKLDEQSAALAAVRDLVGQVGSGEIAAYEVVRQIGQRLAGIAPPAAAEPV